MALAGGYIVVVAIVALVTKHYKTLLRKYSNIRKKIQGFEETDMVTRKYGGRGWRQ